MPPSPATRTIVDVAAPTVPLPGEDGLQATVTALAGLERAACSEGEREAAEWIAARLAERGCDVSIDPAEAYDQFAGSMSQLTAVGVAAGLAGLAGRRGLAALAGAAAALLIADDASNGPRLFRRATRPRRPTQNVVAVTGDRHADRTVVVLGHHDAAPTGLIFDPAGQALIAEKLPGILERIDTSLPIWWPVAGGPALVALGALRRRRGLVAFGTLTSAVATAVFADIARHRIVPGASDNLTAVAGLVALAESFRDRPVEGVRVVLVSCGAEEVLQGGIHGFVADRLADYPREQTVVVNLETLGGARLVMLEGEGTFVMEDYFDRSFRDRAAAVAARSGIPLRRGMRARSSTDSVITSRAGYPTLTLCSMNRHKALEHYHLPTDTAENVDYVTTARAIGLTEALIRDFAGGR